MEQIDNLWITMDYNGLQTEPVKASGPTSIHNGRPATCPALVTNRPNDLRLRSPSKAWANPPARPDSKLGSQLKEIAKVQSLVHLLWHATWPCIAPEMNGICLKSHISREVLHVFVRLGVLVQCCPACRCCSFTSCEYLMYINYCQVG